MTEMAVQRVDPDLKIAALDERVTSFGTRLSTFESNVQRSFTQLDQAINALSQQIQSNQRTPWPTLISLGILLLGFVGAIGGLAYLPIRQGLDRVEAAQERISGDVQEALNALPDKYITRAETERIAVWTAEERAQTQARITALESAIYAPAWERRR